MRHLTIAGATLALCSALAASVAHAGPSDYVATPTVEEGEKEIDFKLGTQRNHDGGRETATSIGLGWGVNSWWFTEVYAKYKREPEASMSFDAWEWENRFQLTESGKYPVDVGFLLEIERPKDRSEGYEITYGPLLQAEWGKVQGNFNLLVQRHVSATTAFDTELHYQAQVKYRQSEQLEWGAQALGSVGQWDHWSDSDQQEHKIGPAVFGKIKTGTKQAIKWNAALLRGLTTASPTTTLRFQAEYEF
jgi:hypothetical protein